MTRPYIIKCERCNVKFASSSSKTGQYHSRCKPLKKRNGYPKGFSIISKFIFARDNYICQKCFKNCEDGISPHAHHIDANKKNNKTTNLVTLCPSCHMNLHRLGLEKFKVKSIYIPKDKKYIKKNKNTHMFRNI